MINIYKVINNQDLFSFLESNGIPKKRIKQLLKYESVLVNDKVVTQFNYSLNKNDLVIIKNNRTDFFDNETKLKILYEDKDIIVVNKPEKLLTISTVKEKEHTLYHQVSEYVKKNNYRNHIFIIHRLDKETSGIVMFAKNEKIKEIYQDNWDKLIEKRGYIAIVEGKLNSKHGIITKKIEEDSNGYVKISNNGKNAITKYSVIKENELYSLLEVEIETGRKNQIRVHMKSLNHPIIGDAKYGSNVNPMKRMGLHANELIILNPVTKEKMIFKAKMPDEFKYLFKEKIK